MIGAIIGDIVGSRFEWDNHRSKDFDFLTHQCFFTDDSVMSLAVCDALMHCKPDYSDLSNITIESMQRIGRPYPHCGYGGSFYRWMYSDKGSNVTWSLEHIHAQQSEGMKTQDVWKKWLELHIPSVESIGGEHSELIDEMQGAINADKLERTVFESIQQKVLGLLSVSGNTEYMHSIANLALLNTADNAALNNSTFDVKRNDIIQMDKKGQYIPFCTKMVFLKYYTPSAENQLHFWGQADRIAYIKAINDVLSDYIEPIVLEKEETK